jgi:nucleotide-binding universal stress UspA family protein
MPAETLIRVARELSADLLVVGRRGHGGFAELLLGSVPHTLSHHADVPLVIVPVVSGDHPS